MNSSVAILYYHWICVKNIYWGRDIEITDSDSLIMEDIWHPTQWLLRFILGGRLRFIENLNEKSDELRPWMGVRINNFLIAGTVPIELTRLACLLLVNCHRYPGIANVDGKVPHSEFQGRNSYSHEHRETPSRHEMIFNVDRHSSDYLLVILHGKIH